MGVLQLSLVNRAQHQWVDFMGAGRKHSELLVPSTPSIADGRPDSAHVATPPTNHKILAGVSTPKSSGVSGQPRRVSQSDQGRIATNPVLVTRGHVLQPMLSKSLGESLYQTGRLNHDVLIHFTGLFHRQDSYLDCLLGLARACHVSRMMNALYRNDSMGTWLNSIVPSFSISCHTTCTSDKIQADMLSSWGYLLTAMHGAAGSRRSSRLQKQAPAAPKLQERLSPTKPKVKAKQKSKSPVKTLEAAGFRSKRGAGNAARKILKLPNEKATFQARGLGDLHLVK